MIRVVKVFLLAVLVVGCGDRRPPLVSISGQVLIDGKPLAGGAIRVLPSQARPAMSRIDAQGRFSLSTYEDDDGCVRGVHPVEIISFENELGGEIRRWRAPRSYSNAHTSGLTLVVEESNQNVNIQLTWNGLPPEVEKFNPENAGASHY